MASYIDVDLLLENIKESVVFTARDKNSPEIRGARKIINEIKNAPIADVVGVVRCKECRLRKTDRCPMYYEEDIEWDDDGYIEIDTIFHDNTTDDSFCSYGERSDT